MHFNNLTTNIAKFLVMGIAEKDFKFTLQYSLLERDQKFIITYFRNFEDSYILYRRNMHIHEEYFI